MKNETMTLNYIAELKLPSKSAQSIQVMKMCDSFSRLNLNVNLYVYNNIDSSKILKIYNCQSQFKIHSLGIENNNFFSRLYFAIKLFLIFLNKNNQNYIYSRSIISAILLSIIKKNIILEIHHEFTGFTKQLFNYTKNFNFFKNIKIVYISNNLKNFFKIKNKNVVLDDAVDIREFNVLRKEKKIDNTCLYSGSFTKGKGIENILKIAKLSKNTKFHLYGDLSNSRYTELEFRKYKNVFYNGYVKYNKIPSILNKYYLYLMPYSKEVYVRSKSIEVSNYMSPLKLFEYLASDGVLMASKMDVYKHILNKNNSILVDNKSPHEWKRNIDKFFKNTNKYKRLSINSSKIAKKYTWNNRARKILKFLNV